jgi:hypothetical protein
MYRPCYFFLPLGLETRKSNFHLNRDYFLLRLLCVPLRKYLLALRLNLNANAICVFLSQKLICPYLPYMVQTTSVINPKLY